MSDEGSSQNTPGSQPFIRLDNRRRRLLFFGVSAAVLVGILVVFREVLLPFLLAIVVAYVVEPIVGVIQKIMPRWLAVLLLYLALLGGIAAFAVVGIPRLAVEVEKLGAEIPTIIRSARNEWIPAAERFFREQMVVYGGNEEMLDQDPDLVELGPGVDPRPELADGGVPPASLEYGSGVPVYGFDAGVPPPSSESIVITPTEGGGYQVHLPPSGISVHPEGDDSLRITTGARPETEKKGLDLTTAFSDALERVTDNTGDSALVLIQTAQTVVQAVIKGVFNFFIMLMLSAYLLITSDKIFAFFRSLVRPNKQQNFDRLLKRIDRGLSGVVRGQLLIALVNGILSGIGFYLFDLQYWPILTVIATVLSIIPIFGALISSIPEVLIGLQDGFTTALLVLAWIVGIHQLEANVLNPKIMGDAAKVHPVLVIFALLAGEAVFGIVGALLAVPVLSIVQSLFLHFRELTLGVPARSSIPPPAPD